MTPKGPAAPLREVRYSLKQLLEEVAVERLSGAFGQEKLGQKDIRRAFKAKSRSRRAQ
jgi:hypothetical protein